MKDDMRWEQKAMNENLHSTGPGRGNDYTGSGIFKAGLAIVAGLIIAALARGVRKSEDFEEYQEFDGEGFTQNDQDE